MARDLHPAERRTLQAVCAALLPPDGSGETASAAAPFTAHPHIATRIAEAISTTGRPEDLGDLRLLLRLLESPFSRLLTGGGWGRFTGLDRQRQESILRRWSQSRIPKLRQGFQALKRLTGFFACALVDETTGRNPNWDLVGYEGPVMAGPAATAPAEAAAPPLRPLPVTGDLDFAADAVVIGSGAGGAVAAATLAAAGLDVLVLEKGQYYSEADFTGLEVESMERLYLDRGMLATRDQGVAMLAGSCLGGGTVVNWAACLPPPDSLLAEWEREHGMAGATGPELNAAVRTVTDRLGVSETAARIAAESSAGRLLAGCAALGYRTRVMPLNLQGCGGPECGDCCFGCRRGTKQSTLKNFLPDAVARGARIAVGCTVDRVLVQAGQVAGVSGWVDAGDRRYALRVRAPRVILAAGALHSPAILLRSGLTNPHIGRHLHLHPTAAVVGFYPEPMEAWKGPLLPAYSPEFASLRGGYGVMLETAPGHPGLAGMAMPWGGSAQYGRDLLALRNAGIIIVLTRDRDGGRVTVDRRGRPQFDYRVSGFDAVHMRRGIAAAARVHAAAGAREVLTLHAPVTRAVVQSPEWDGFTERLERMPVGPNQVVTFSAHQMGTCRMGSSPRTAVADPEGQVWGVRGLYVCDGSAFPSASGINPMLTIMGLARWNAERIP